MSNNVAATSKNGLSGFTLHALGIRWKVHGVALYGCHRLVHIPLTRSTDDHACETLLGCANRCPYCKVGMTGGHWRSLFV
eukprot:3481117-Amphidinium_carterae.1